jgi:hypothetical protein
MSPQSLSPAVDDEDPNQSPVADIGREKDRANRPDQSRANRGDPVAGPDQRNPDQGDKANTTSTR